MENFKNKFFFKEISNNSFENLRNFSFDTFYSLTQTISNKQFVDINSSNNPNKDILSLTDNKELNYNEKELFEGESEDECGEKAQEEMKSQSIINNKILMKKETNLNLVNIYNKNVNFSSNQGDHMSEDSNKSSLSSIIDNINTDCEKNLITIANSNIDYNKFSIKDIYNNLTLSNNTRKGSKEIKAFLRLYTNFCTSLGREEVPFKNEKRNEANKGVAREIDKEFNQSVVDLIITKFEDFYYLYGFWLSYIYLLYQEHLDKFILKLYNNVFEMIIKAIETKLCYYSEYLNANWIGFINDIPHYSTTLLFHLAGVCQGIYPSNKKIKDSYPQFKLNPNAVALFSKQNINLQDFLFKKLLEMTSNYNNTDVSGRAIPILVEHFYDSENGVYESKISEHAISQFHELKSQSMQEKDENFIKPKIYLLLYLWLRKNTKTIFCKEIPIVYSEAPKSVRALIEKYLRNLKEPGISQVVNYCNGKCEKLIEIIIDKIKEKFIENAEVLKEVLGYVLKYEKYDLLNIIINNLSFEDFSERIIPFIFTKFNVGDNLEKDKRNVELLKKINKMSLILNSGGNAIVKDGLLLLLHDFARKKGDSVRDDVKRKLIRFYTLLKDNDMSEFYNLVEWMLNRELEETEDYWKGVMWVCYEFSLLGNDIKVEILGK